MGQTGQKKTWIENVAWGRKSERTQIYIYLIARQMERVITITITDGFPPWHGDLWLILCDLNGVHPSYTCNLVVCREKKHVKICIQGLSSSSVLHRHQNRKKKKNRIKLTYRTFLQSRV